MATCCVGCLNYCALFIRMESRFANRAPVRHSSVCFRSVLKKVKNVTSVVCGTAPVEIHVVGRTVAYILDFCIASWSLFTVVAIEHGFGGCRTFRNSVKAHMLFCVSGNYVSCILPRCYRRCRALFNATDQLYDQILVLCCPNSERFAFFEISLCETASHINRGHIMSISKLRHILWQLIT